MFVCHSFSLSSKSFPPLGQLPCDAPYIAYFKSPSIPRCWLTSFSYFLIRTQALSFLLYHVSNVICKVMFYLTFSTVSAHWRKTQNKDMRWIKVSSTTMVRPISWVPGVGKLTDGSGHMIIKIFPHFSCFVRLVLPPFHTENKSV